jgi:hypothetical protein
VIITEVLPRFNVSRLDVSALLNVSTRLLERFAFPTGLLRRLAKPSMQFLPDYRTRVVNEAWWRLPPETVAEFIGVLGFEKIETRYHWQKCKGRMRKLYTIVGHRTRESKGF